MRVLDTVRKSGIPTSGAQCVFEMGRFDEMKSFTFLMLLIVCVVGGCSSETDSVAGSAGAESAVPISSGWLGIPSAVNKVIVMLHEGTGMLLNKSEVEIKKLGVVQPIADGWQAEFSIKVEYGGESFETTAPDVPCDELGIPTEASVERIRTAVEEIKDKMSRFQL